MTENKTLKIKEAAKLLNRSTKSLRNYVKAGKLKAKKINGPKGPEFVFSLNEIENFAKNSLKISVDKAAVKKDKVTVKDDKKLALPENMDFGKFTDILLQTESEKMQVVEEFAEYKARLAYKVGQLEAQIKTVEDLKKERNKLEKKLDDMQHLYRVRDEDARQLMNMKIFYDQKKWWQFWKSEYNFYDSEKKIQGEYDEK